MSWEGLVRRQGSIALAVQALAVGEASLGQQVERGGDVSGIEPQGSSQVTHVGRAFVDEPQIDAVLAGTEPEGFKTERHGRSRLSQ